MKKASNEKRHWSSILIRLGACQVAVEWAKTQPSLSVAWAKCPRGDWMLWLASRACKPNSVEHRRVVLAACKCARLALKYVPKGEGRPLAAIVIAEKWARGVAGVTIVDVRSAAADAALAAANAATAAVFAAYSAADATDAVYAAANAANADAEPKTQLATARAVRKVIPRAPHISK